MRPSAAPLVSVVLSTRNRADTLRGAIRSLLELDPGSPAHELIIVDNASGDHTRAVVEEFVPGAGGRLHYVHEPTPGLPYGRNAGVAMARGAYIAFTDDDVRADPCWLTALVRAIEARSGVAFAGGKVLPMWPRAVPSWLTRHNWAPLALVDYGDEGFETSIARAVCLIGANVMFRREVFERFGGFDPHYKHEHGAVTAVEDYEFELRLYTAGLRGWYEPTAVIHAEVQEHRLAKTYHRKWYFDHGRAIIRTLPRGYTLNPDSLPQRAPSTPCAFGVPLYMYKQLVLCAGDVVRRAAAGEPGERFRALGHLHETLGAMHFYATTRRRSEAGYASERPPAIEFAHPGRHGAPRAHTPGPAPTPILTPVAVDDV